MTEIETNTVNQFPAKTRNKYLIIAAVLSIFNLIAFITFVKNGSYDLDGNYMDYNRAKNIKSAIITFLVGLPVLSFLLGLLVALLPYRKMSYSKKYVRASLLSLSTINSIFAILLVFIMVMTFLGAYSNKALKETPVRIANKEQTIANFNKEMDVFIDSANVYADRALMELERGEKPEAVYEKIGPKMTFFEGKLDKRARMFQQEATNAGTSMEEYKKVVAELNKRVAPLMDKVKKLKAKGFNIE